ncbi:tRNA lysidine(34) synthetase TilS [Candidatus Aquiluna sp. UB-MaderosW2red]|uniref:tRNA lysidine(34) synthetase TilS n=1 Tax=Candidatus Aquiluna sp. UB-MaderosW2red TaxID=1855377 RepID=UPI000875B7FA|nr:tRNA lysidine(34) synthetase TilS [Candidatus Aquiluna sp. UB-MaderosW2red]SCX02816.1 tRNA(Ile)-lysidine synthase [Candidatus Aquiluna sp. UB-MaderosW2red]
MELRPRLTPAIADVRRAVRETLSKLNLVAGDTILVAVSGGGDSLALASATIFEANKLKLNVAAAIIDHGLQQNSDVVAQNTKQVCKALGLEPVLVSRVSVTQAGAGLEAAARNARYRELENIRVQLYASYIFLGHNQGDQAETVLLGLVRGSGLSAISGMREIDEERKLIRPLLGLTRSLLRQSVLDQGLEIWDDPQNLDEDFTRVKARRILAELEVELAPGIAESLSRTALLVQESEDYLLNQANQLMLQVMTDGGYAIELLAKAQIGLRRKTLHLIALANGAKSLSRSQVLEMDALVTNWHGQKPLSLSGITVERVNNQLVLLPGKPLNPGA